jgi:hypothetical protein
MSANDSYIMRDSTKYMLLLTNNFEGTKIFLHSGEKIQFKYNRHQFKGTLDSVGEQTFYVGGNEYRLDKLQNIKIFKQINGFKKNGLFFSILSCLILMIAGYLYLDAKKLGFWNDESMMITLVVYGLLIVAGNFIFLGGLFFLLGNTYRYWFPKSWRIESVLDVK